jgi:hypothetical protein
MNNKPTPETDAAIYPMTGVDIVWPEFARKLERERDDLQKAVNGLCEHIGVNPANTTLLAVEVLKIERERNEARELLASEKITRNHIIKRSVEVERERDEAREKLENEMKWHHRTHRELIEAQCKLLDIEYDKLKS